MKLINQNAEFIKQEPGIEGIYKIVELAGRTSYLSWDKMTDDSAKKFVDMLVRSKHTSVLEHGNVYLHFFWPGAVCQVCNQTMPHKLLDKYCMNSYSKVNYHGNDVYVTTNMRVLQENNWLDDLKYLCEPTEFHEKRLSVKVITSRSISHELVRHRSMSFIQESQRYVGYDKDKFGGEITYIIPSWLNIPCGKVYPGTTGYKIVPDENKPHEYYKTENPGFPFATKNFLNALYYSETTYNSLRNLEYKPQEAREILPNATKTTLVITAFESDWREWFAQRLFGKTGEPHPDMLVLANLIKDEFEKAGVWEGIMKYPSKYD